MDQRKKNYGNSLDWVKIKDNETIEGERPITLAECLPNMLMVYAKILEPYSTGDVQTHFLRAVSLDIQEYKYDYTKVKFAMFNAFQSIEIDIRDKLGQQ